MADSEGFTVSAVNANTMQRLWCTMLLERGARSLPRMRARILETRAWLEAHPSRTLHEAYRERLGRYERILDARDAAHAQPTQRRAPAKALPRQLALPLVGSRKGRS